MTDVEIAENWELAFTQRLNATLGEAGVLPDGALFWTGSDSQGALVPGENCEGWAVLDELGRTGTADGIASGAWVSGGPVPCSTNQRILCLCAPSLALGDQ